MDKKPVRLLELTPTMSVSGLDAEGRIALVEHCARIFNEENCTSFNIFFRAIRIMVRMADVYLNEGRLQRAYTLYLRFMNCFEELRILPGFESVSLQELHRNIKIMNSVVPKAKELRTHLPEQYTHKYKHCEEQKKKRKVKQPGKEDDRSKKCKLKITPEDSPEERDKITPGTSGVSLLAVSPSNNFRNRLLKVVIPSALTTSFVGHAQWNTKRNTETCGILAGRNNETRLIITHLVIAMQRGTADTCEAINEEEIFDFITGNNLLHLGWIHTHPKQDLFMSSVDLHTHCSFQREMPEALAIACIPKNHRFAFYRLTPDGMNVISKCHGTGFHEHPIFLPLFEEVHRCRVYDDFIVQTVDLRC